MKGRHVVLGTYRERQIAALMTDGRLDDLFTDASGIAAFAPGAILRGRVERPMKGQGGVFVRLPDGAKGFLRDRGGLSEGQAVLVQVSGVAEAGKAIPLTARLLFRGRYAIVTPGVPGINVSRRIRDEARRTVLTAMGASALAGDESFGLILRSAAEAAPDDEIADELGPLVEIAGSITTEQEGSPELLLDAPSPWEQAWIDWADPAPDQIDQDDAALTETGALDQIEALLSPEVPLQGGASAVIEATRALVAVDVNTGADTSLAAGLKANMALARDLPRQLRLRGLGGQIVVDFAPMPKRDRASLDQVLKAAFRGDGAETTLVGWTAMGLYEINRKRDRAPLSRVLGGKH
ncbi:ribonuclease E/G (plasmid) [Paracoccus sp. TK19116]|uniref:Ribonuclease E/G n=1 Tax=Paracoccus albicereus TaxID=2922394 RepID=A0ABT1MKP5_9RHOB|nr:ribonuclease E/G [Paracoccus albicereus]MCQ0968867.1 ribonuclease E/G [Paracoccus albicereus]